MSRAAKPISWNFSVSSADQPAHESPRGRVVLKPRRARPFFARHPWVYTHSVARVEGPPAPGDEVEVFSHEGVFIARGLYNPASTLCTRLYRWDRGPLDSGFWLGKLQEAIRLRRDTLRLGGRGRTRTGSSSARGTDCRG